MLVSIWAWLSSAFSALGGILALLNKAAEAAQAAQQKQAGVDEVTARDATAEADAVRKTAEISTQGQSNAQTQADLDRGEF